jgi:hypothetical protein
MPLDAVLSESTQLALAEAGKRRTPITIWGPAADVGLVARNRFGDEHSSLLRLVYQAGSSVWGNF